MIRRNLTIEDAYETGRLAAVFPGRHAIIAPNPRFSQDRSEEMPLTPSRTLAGYFTGLGLVELETGSGAKVLVNPKLVKGVNQDMGGTSAIFIDVYDDETRAGKKAYEGAWFVVKGSAADVKEKLGL